MVDPLRRSRNRKEVDSGEREHRRFDVIAGSPCDEKQSPGAACCGPGLLAALAMTASPSSSMGAARRRNDRPRVLFRNEDALLHVVGIDSPKNGNRPGPSSPTSHLPYCPPEAFS